MAQLAWWSAPVAKLGTKYQQQNSQLHFVHMIQDLPVTSSFEVIFMFPGQNFIQIIIHSDNVR